MHIIINVKSSIKGLCSKDVRNPQIYKSLNYYQMCPKEDIIRWSHHQSLITTMSLLYEEDIDRGRNGRSECWKWVLATKA